MEKKPDRRYFFIDVSNIPKCTAQEYIEKIKGKFIRPISFKEVLEREDPPPKENS